MEFKNHSQFEVISHLNTLNDQLGAARNKFLLKKAGKEHGEAKLIREAIGASNAEKVNNAKAQKEWLEIHTELAHLESVYEFLKLKFRILENEYQSQYLETKLNEGLIKKQG